MTGRTFRTGLTVLRVVAALRVLPVVVRTARVVRGGTPDPGSSATIASPARRPTISVVIPARDEADRIEPLLAALGRAPGVDELIVVDDESTDETAATAARVGARVIAGSPTPPGWAGKTWALEQGLAVAAGEWLICLDADTRPTPDLPTWLIDRARSDRLDLVSVSGVIDLPATARWLHAAMLATLVYRFGGPGTTTVGREIVNGQCVAFRRTALVDAGGFGLVADAVTEDVALARALARRGWRVGLVDGGHRLVVEPYRSLGEVWSGWGRSIGLPGVEPRLRVTADAAVLLVTMSVPFWRLLRRSADVLDLVLAAVRIGSLVGMRSAYRDAGPGYWCSPLADPVAVAAIACSAVRRSVTWRGRRLAVGAR